MKKILSAILILTLIFSCLVIPFAQADYGGYYDSPYMYRWTGIVICTNITVRATPSTSAKKYGQLHNGDVIYILGEDGDFYAIDLISAGIENQDTNIGYVLKALIKESPTWIVLTKYTETALTNV